MKQRKYEEFFFLILGKLDEVKLLIENGAYIEGHTNEGDTPIDLAYEKGN